MKLIDTFIKNYHNKSVPELDNELRLYNYIITTLIVMDSDSNRLMIIGDFKRFSGNLPQTWM